MSALSVQGKMKSCAMEASCLSLNCTIHWAGSRECRMASIPTRTGLTSTSVLPRVGDSARTLFTTALKTETGLGSALIRSSAADRGRSNRCSGSIGDRSQTSGGVGHDPSDIGQGSRSGRLAGSGSQEFGTGTTTGSSSVSYASSEDSRETGPIVGASQIRLRFALRLGQGRCSHTHGVGEAARAAGGPGDRVQGHQPRTRLMRAWTHAASPRDLPLHHTRLPDSAEQSNLTDAYQTKRARTGPTRRPSSRGHSRRQGSGGAGEELEGPAVASRRRPAHCQRSRGGASTLPCWEDAGSSVGRRHQLTQPDARAPVGESTSPVIGLGRYSAFIIKATFDFE